LTRKLIRPIFALLLLLATNLPLSAQGIQLNEFSSVEELYEKEQYEQAYQEFIQIFKNKYVILDLDDQSLMLDWGIRLSFIVEDWVALDTYVGMYYELDPYFSASSLREYSPQLEKYIENYVRSQSEQFVYVNKHRQNIDLIPSTITVYTKADIEALGARNLLDLIRLTPGFAEIGDNNERLVGTRGASSTTLQDVLFLINGHRLNDILTNTTAPDWISLDYVEQVELVRGPGSALYGGSAFSGVVNIITKNGRFQNVNRLKVDVGNGNSLRSFRNVYNNYHLNYEYGRKLNNTEGIYFSGTFFTSGGSEKDYSRLDNQIALPDVLDTTVLRNADLFGTEFVNAYAPGYNLLVNYHRNALQLTANAQSSTFLYARPSSFNNWESFDRETFLNQRRRRDRREFVQLEYDLLEGSDFAQKGDLRFKLSGDHFKKDFFTSVYSIGVDGNTRLVGDEYRGTFNLEFSSDSLLSRQGALKNHFLMGLEAFINNWFYQYYTEQDSNLVLTSIDDHFTAPGEDRHEYIGALYLQTEQHIVNDVLVATAGVRFNYHNQYSRFDHFVWGEEYSPRFALVFNPMAKKELQHFKFKLMYNSAFLPPPFLYRKGGISQFVGSTDLDVQNIESGEFVVNGDINKNLSYSVQTYINRIDNFILRVGNRYINDPMALRNSGFEAELRYRKSFEKLKIRAFANYSYAEQRNFGDSLELTFFDVFQSSKFNSKNTLSQFPSNKLAIGFYGTYGESAKARSPKRSTNKPLNWTFGADLQWIGETDIVNIYDIDSNGQLTSLAAAERQQIASATIVNARAMAHWRRVSFGLSAFNLFGEDYFLPSVISRINRQKAEGQMFYLNFNYRLKAM
jgi:outer membrane receptor for ferrienterochelin and colicin